VPSKGSWTANVSVQVRTEAGTPAAYATVTGAWSEGGSGSTTCTTNAYGWCNVSKSGLKKGASSVRFSVSGVSLAGGTYDPSLNSDIEGDSDGTSIRIAKP